MDKVAARPRPWWHIDRRAAEDRWLTLRAITAASKPLTIAVLGCVFVGAALPVAFTVATGIAAGSVEPAIRDGLSSASGQTLLRSVVVVGALFVIQQTLAPVRDGVVDLLGRYFRRDLFRRSMVSTLRPPTIAHLEDPALKDLIAKVNEIGIIGPRAAVQGLATQWMVRLAAIGNLVLVVRYTPVVGLILFAALVHEQRRYRESHQQLTAMLWKQAQRLRRSNYLLSLCTGPESAKEVRLFGLPNWLIEQYRAAWLTVMRSLWQLRQHNWPNAFKGTVPVIVIEVIALALIGRRSAAGALGVGAMVIYAQALVGSLNLAAVSDADSYVEEGVRVVRSLLELEQSLANDAALQMTGDRSPAGMPADGVRFEKVSFRYPGQEREVFTNLDLDIQAGRSLAIVGANGAGKTTLVKLIARLYDPMSGRITVDGTDLRELDPRAWQKRVAAIFQDFIRYPLTAAANVGFGAPDQQDDLAALQRAAEGAAVSDLIERLPAGWDTTLSRQYEGGVELSGGEWQRIALARALFAAGAGASVLILDEPTAQLDVRAEAAFYDRFLDVTKGLTTIVISHRFSTVRRADRIVVLDGGAIVEDGSHEELLAANGKYAEMFNLQADRFVDA